jgi:hypothetical protein
VVSGGRKGAKAFALAEGDPTAFAVEGRGLALPPSRAHGMRDGGSNAGNAKLEAGTEVPGGALLEDKVSSPIAPRLVSRTGLPRNGLRSGERLEAWGGREAR